HSNAALTRFKDLEVALVSPLARAATAGDEWRVHFHIPLHCQPPGRFESTADHILGLLKLLQDRTGLCSHLEMEAYTWAVLPDALRTRNVSDQIVAEYKWTLARLAEHGLARSDLAVDRHRTAPLETTTT